MFANLFNEFRGKCFYPIFRGFLAWAGAQTTKQQNPRWVLYDTASDCCSEGVIGALYFGICKLKVENDQNSKTANLKFSVVSRHYYCVLYREAKRRSISTESRVNQFGRCNEVSSQPFTCFSREKQEEKQEEEYQD
jgi:hypothetical protein